MSRRFLYMVVGKCSMTPSLPSSYALHRISPSSLFYPKDSPKRLAAAAAAGARSTTMEAAEAAERARAPAMQMEEAVWRARTAAMQPRATKPDGTETASLPVSHMNFSSPSIVMDFALVGRSKDKIVVVDGTNPEYAAQDDWEAPGRAVLYDDASHSVRALLGNRLPDRETVPIAVGDNLYFMDEEEEVVPCKKTLRALIRYPEREPDSCDGDPRYRTRDPDHDPDHDWYWYSFPPPPYEAIGTGENDPRPRYPERRDMLGAFVVVGESQIWASTRIRGTYSLDTVSGTWSSDSDAPLPFGGRAEYAPEHGLWFGFPNDEWQYKSGDSGLLCVWDLNSIEPGARGVWEVFGAPSGSFNVRSLLVHLGDGGRFCVAKLYQMYDPLPAGACSRCYNDGVPDQISFAVLTGVEVERCEEDGELRMIKHRSCKYSFDEFNFPHTIL